MSIISLMPYILGVQALVLGVVGTWLVWHFKLRTVYRAEFYRQIGSSTFGSKKLVKIGSKDFKPDSDHVSFRNKAYTILFEKMVSTNGRISTWAFDIETGVGLTFGGSHDCGDSDFAEDLLYTGFCKRLAHYASSFDMSLMIVVILMVVMCVMAFAVGVFVSPYLLPTSGGA